VLNADAWCPEPLDPLVRGWDGERARLLVVGGDALAPDVRIAGCALPWHAVLAGTLRPPPRRKPKFEVIKGGKDDG
jgi:hypothetical protein